MNLPARLVAIALAALIVAAPSAAQDRPTGGAIGKLVPPVPTPTSFISDERKVIPAHAHTSLDASIRAIQSAGLGDIAVAILPSVGDYTPSQVALEIYRTWKVGTRAEIGSAQRNLGVLILIVPKEISPNNRGECWINTGLGAEGIITDATAASICRDAIIPRLRVLDHAGGVAAGIAAIEARLRRDAGLTTEAASDGEEPDTPGHLRWGYGVASGILALMVGLTLRKALRYRRRKCKKCGRKMRRLSEQDDDTALEEGQRVEERIKSIDYDVWACDCGETLVIPYIAWFAGYENCRECKRRTASAKRKVVERPTVHHGGWAEETYTCKSCKATWVERKRLPKVTPISDSGSSGSSGGGGDSFGGSGSSSGGGGGSSY